MEKCIPKCVYREEVIELQEENRRLRRGIKRILEVRKPWSSVVNPGRKKMLTEVFTIAKQFLE